MNTWIKITDKDPPKESVLVTDGETIGITRLRALKGKLLGQFGFTELKKPPTHWMKLPELPNG